MLIIGAFLLNRSQLMKKCLSLGYLATTLGLALGLASAANAADATLSPGKIKIAMEVAYPPFESWQDDAIVGSMPNWRRCSASKQA
jgi:multisubunit Na+/H+ antiporter MnhC subunit